MNLGLGRWLKAAMLEDYSVIPYIQVALDRKQLLQGIDAQLHVALQYAAEHAGR